MADITLWVDTDVVGPGTGTELDPYDTIQSAVPDLLNDLTANQTGLINCRGVAADDPGGPIDFNAPTVTTSDITIEIRPWPGADDGQYTGTLSYDANFYRIEGDAGVTSAGLLDLREAAGNIIVDIEGIQIFENSSSGTRFGIAVENGNRLRMNKVRLRGPATSEFTRGIRTSGGTSGLAVECKNCIIFDWNSGFNGNTAEDATFINCAFHNNDVGTAGEAIESGTGTIKCTNTLLWNNHQDYRDEGATEDFDANASEDTNIRGTGGVDIANPSLAANIEDNNATHANVDCRPASGSNYASIGLTNGTDSDVTTDDITNAARNTGSGQNTSDGPFAAAGEGPSAGGPVVQVYHARHHNKAL